jgi:hypothetical protein
MTSNAGFVKRIRPGRHVLVSGFFMAVTAIVCLVIIQIVMAVQTIQIILIRVCLVGKQNFACIVLKHETDRIGWSGRGKSGVTDDPCDQKNSHDQDRKFQVWL